jgi:hypothetical protein
MFPLAEKIPTSFGQASKGIVLLCWRNPKADAAFHLKKWNSSHHRRLAQSAGTTADNSLEIAVSFPQWQLLLWVNYRILSYIYLKLE